jgi:cellulose synthase/poly-beta-1,6-N-acetylglucosamine synthase-like glycosyltransferase
VAVVLAAHNEEPAIGRRVRELAGLVAAAGPGGAVIVVSDGSTDRTAAAARAAAAAAPAPVRVLELPARQGKAAALNAGCAAAAAAGAAFIAFADARQHWDTAALERLLENFADPTVGAVSGDLVVEAPPGVLAGVGLYWRFEKWLRQAESRAGSLAGVTGSIAAVRQALFRPMPPGTILDDVDWPLQVACQGYRLVHDGRAVAHDRLPPRARDEFRRKLRTLCGNFQLLARRPALLVPWRNPVWWQLVSHRVLRLAVPWALLVALGSSALLAAPAYRVAFAVQVALYLLGLAGFWRAAAARCRPAAAAASFLVLNAAAWLAFWVWATGGAARSWARIAYDAPRPTPARPPWSPAP